MSVDKKLVVIHHQPLEIFPPVLNFLNYLSTVDNKCGKVYVVTTKTDLNFKHFDNADISIKRLYTVRSNSGTLDRLMNFAFFTIKTLLYLIKWRPNAILYYESHSALPVYLYFKFFSAKAKLFIHYHEYMTPAEYNRKGMRLVNYSHKREKYLYTLATWISHTNHKRMELFLADNGYIDQKVCEVLPNFPPRSWKTNNQPSRSFNQPIRMVYIGSFGSLEHLHIKELLTWTKSLEGELTLDIYSYNVSPEVQEFVSALGARNVELKGNLNYEDIPSVLKNYNVGLIFYKATSLNVQHCAPNKLFEYLACGLDVWFSEEMTGCYPYVREQVYPKVIMVDFNNLKTFNYQKALDRNGLVESKTDFFYETVYNPLVDKLAEC